MDLSQYISMIEKKLMDNVRSQVKAENENAKTSLYNKRNADQYKTVSKSIIKSKPQNTPIINDDNSDEEIEGGKVHFLKHMGNIAKNTGKSIGKQVVKKATSAASTAIVAGLGAKMALGSVAPEIASVAAEVGPEIGMAAAEAAPYAPLLLAAGIKSKKRPQSAKQIRRHALVQKLMKEHHISMCVASSLIKDQDIQY